MKFFFPAIFFILASFIGNAQTSTEKLEPKIDSIFKSTQSDFAIAFKDLSEEKEGWITGVQHDPALIELPDGRKYILVLLFKNMEDMDAGMKVLTEVSKMKYDHLN